jgi:AcrR family transcriptional regulator
MSSTDALPAGPERPQRADARRNLDALLTAARDVFGESGVDAPVRGIAARAGVGVGTVYRHFPQRSDLIVAVFRREVDACAAEAPRLAAEYGAEEALIRWIHRFTGFVAAKQGLSPALHSGDPIYLPLRDYFEDRFAPVLSELLSRAAEEGSIRADVAPVELLNAVSRLCDSPAADSAASMRMVDLLLDGLRVSSVR